VWWKETAATRVVCLPGAADQEAVNFTDTLVPWPAGRPRRRAIGSLLCPCVRYPSRYSKHWSRGYERPKGLKLQNEAQMWCCCAPSSWNMFRYTFQGARIKHFQFKRPEIRNPVHKSSFKFMIFFSPATRAGQSGFDPRQGQRTFLLAPASRPTLGPTQPPIQWVPGVLPPGVKRGRGVTLTTHPHLVPRLRTSRTNLLSPMCLHGM
jgi:hypothetical protein